MGRRVAGIAYIKVDGTQLEASGTWEAPLNNTVKETVMGLAGAAGYKETAQRPHIKGEVIFVPDFPISTLNSMTNATITLELANGKVATLTGAWLEGETIADGTEGKVPVEFSGTNLVWS